MRKVQIVYKGFGNPGKAAVKKNFSKKKKEKKMSYSISYCDRPISDKDDEFTKLQVLKSNGWAIRHLTKPSVGLQLIAVRECGFAIDKIENPSEVVRRENHNVWHVKWKPNCCSIGYEEFWINLLSKVDSPLFRSLPLDMIKKIAKMLAEMPMKPRKEYRGKYLNSFDFTK